MKLLRLILAILLAIIVLIGLIWVEKDSPYKGNVIIRIIAISFEVLCFNFIAAEVKSYYKSVKNKKN